MENKKLQQPLPEALKDEQLHQVTGGMDLCAPLPEELQDLIRSGDIDLELQTGQIKPRSGT